MAEQQEKLKKLFNARSNLESELHNIHKDITDAIDRQDRLVKVERLVSKLKDVFSKLAQKNEELFDLASKAENPDSIYPDLEQWLDDATKNNDKFLEAEKQEQAAMRLAKQKHEIGTQKKSLKYKWSRWHFKNWRKTTASVLQQLN